MMGNVVLNAVEIRVVGALMEKCYTTPDNYPLSLNALKNACNQKSNRNPVLTLDEKSIAQALESLRTQRLLVVSNAARVVKYAENFVNEYNLVTNEAAILTILFLRGPQTAGELRGRSERIYHFDEVSQVVEVLGDLEDLGYVVKLPKQPGRKEHRFAHLFSGEPKVEEDEACALEPPEVLEVRAENDRVSRLEADVCRLNEELAELRDEFRRFKSEFE